MSNNDGDLEQIWLDASRGIDTSSHHVDYADERRAASERANAAMDRGETPADDDLLVCDAATLNRAQDMARKDDPDRAARVDRASPRTHKVVP